MFMTPSRSSSGKHQFSLGILMRKPILDYFLLTPDTSIVGGAEHHGPWLLGKRLALTFICQIPAITPGCYNTDNEPAQLRYHDADITYLLKNTTKTILLKNLLVSTPKQPPSPATPPEPTATTLTQQLYTPPLSHSPFP